MVAGASYTEEPLCVQVLAEDVLPALQHGPDSRASPAVDLACLPLGVSTGGRHLTLA